MNQIPAVFLPSYPRCFFLMAHVFLLNGFPRPLMELAEYERVALVGID